MAGVAGMHRKNYTGITLSAKKTEDTPTVIGEKVEVRTFLTATEPVDEKDASKGTRLSNVSKAVADELQNGTEVKDKDGRVIGIESANLIAEILSANTKVEEKPYTMEYVGLRAKTVEGALILMDGHADLETEKDDKGNESEVPSIAKYFNQGFGILARNAAAARIRTKVEGPDKALEAAARDLMRAKGWTFEKALAKVKAMVAED